MTSEERAYRRGAHQALSMLADDMAGMLTPEANQRLQAWLDAVTAMRNDPKGPQDLHAVCHAVLTRTGGMTCSTN